MTTAAGVVGIRDAGPVNKSSVTIGTFQRCSLVILGCVAVDCNGVVNNAAVGTMIMAVKIGGVAVGADAAARDGFERDRHRNQSAQFSANPISGERHGIVKLAINPI